MGSFRNFVSRAMKHGLLAADLVVRDENPVEFTRVLESLGPVDNYLSQTIMQAMQIMDMKAWAVLS